MNTDLQDRIPASPEQIPPGFTSGLIQRIAEFRGRFEEQFSERHLHCVWYDPGWRPRELSSTTGEQVRVLHPGEWNLEAGPDFRKAVLEIEGRRMEGDVEIHIRPNDWQHHGHQHDPRYRNVKLHVTYYPGTLPAGQLPPDCIQLALQPSLDSRENFYFEAIDCRAYPWEIQGSVHPLQKQIRALDEPQRIALLEEAGLERVRLKSTRMMRQIGESGADQALYTAMLRALGYKRNGAIMELLAARLPLAELREQSHGDPRTAYALLLGVAGLLSSQEGSPLLRSLQTRWWKREASFQTRIIPASLWRLDAVRPANHPRRRLWAAAVWFVQPDRLEAQVVANAEAWTSRMMDVLSCPPCPLDPPNSTFSNLGEQRKAALLVNALLPFAIGLGLLTLDLGTLRKLPREAENQRVRKMASSLFGPDHHPRLYRSTLCRQGLLQFYEDYGA